MNLRLLPIALVPLLLGACSRPPAPAAPLPPPASLPVVPETRLTYDHYLQIKVGMTEAQIGDLIGKPSGIEAEEVQKNSRVFYVYDNGKGSTMRVGFVNGKVANKSCSLDQNRPAKP